MSTQKNHKNNGDAMMEIVNQFPANFPVASIWIIAGKWRHDQKLSIEVRYDTWCRLMAEE